MLSLIASCRTTTFALVLFLSTDAVRAADTRPDTHTLYLEALSYQRGAGVPIDLEKSRDLLIKAAEAGSPDAMLRLGDMYREADGGVARDYAAALKWYQRLDNAGSPWGAYELANAHRYGRGVPRDLEKSHSARQRAIELASTAAQRTNPLAMTALAAASYDLAQTPEQWAEVKSLLTKAANAGEIRAMINLANLISYSPQPAKQELEKALDLAKQAAATGQAPALICLARLYEKEGLPFYDLALSLEASRKAADRGSAVGIAQVAFAYDEGRGVPVDRAEALKWYRRGAELGNRNCLLELAFCYRDGRGVAKDLAEELKWLRKAAESGDQLSRLTLARRLLKVGTEARDITDAVKLLISLAEEDYAPAMVPLGDAYKRGTGVAADVAAARKWYSRAVELQHPDQTATALSRLGETYQYGDPAQRDYAKAMELLQKAAGLGEFNAMYHIGVLYFEGNGVKQDYVEARKWYLRAANRGHWPAMSDLALIYQNGLGVNADLAEAVNWYRKCANVGGPTGYWGLARYYEHGRGVPKDLAEARRWYIKAADAGVAEAKQWLQDHPEGK